ncbi:MAG TPA: hypothetical protein VFK44_06790 [Bacillales bacterium]|nr:hypothetical protein [Bacillales bacterium]
MRFEKGDIVQMIYMDGQGRLSERYVRVLAVTEDLFTAYCYYRRRPRTFAVRNVLAAELKRRQCRESFTIDRGSKYDGRREAYGGTYESGRSRAE